MTEITFETDDKLDRKVFAQRLTKIISKFYPFYNEAFVLSLNAKYGAGKSTFLKMWKHMLEAEGHSVIYINAWETDFDNEPIIPIVSALLEKISQETKDDKLTKVLSTVLGATALSVNNVLDHVTGINVHEIANQAQKELAESDLEKIGDEVYKGFSYKRRAYEELKNELANYIEKIPTKPLIILIDELDRVRPNYSVQFLEAIKHLFSVKGICFVLAVDRVQLEKSIKNIYGDIDFENYYRRFITREAHLPQYANINPFVENLISNFLDKDQIQGMSFPFPLESKDEVLGFIGVVSCAYSLSPRQIEALFRIFSQLMLIERSQAAVKSWIDMAIILIGILIYNPVLYHRVGRGDISYLEIYNHVTSLNFSYPQNNKNQRKMLMTLIAFSIRRQSEITLNPIIDQMLVYDACEITEQSRATFRKEMLNTLTNLVDPYRGLYDQPRVKVIYDMLEEWRPLIE